MPSDAREHELTVSAPTCTFTSTGSGWSPATGPRSCRAGARSRGRSSHATRTRLGVERHLVPLAVVHRALQPRARDRSGDEVHRLDRVLDRRRQPLLRARRRSRRRGSARSSSPAARRSARLRAASGQASASARSTASRRIVRATISLPVQQPQQLRRSSVWRATPSAENGSMPSSSRCSGAIVA